MYTFLSFLCSSVQFSGIYLLRCFIAHVTGNLHLTTKQLWLYCTASPCHISQMNLRPAMLSGMVWNVNKTTLTMINEWLNIWWIYVLFSNAEAGITLLLVSGFMQLTCINSLNDPGIDGVILQHAYLSGLVPVWCCIFN